MILFKRTVAMYNSDVPGLYTKTQCCFISHAHAGAFIATNIEGNIVCPGENLILTCTSTGTSQRWDVENEAAVLHSVGFTIDDSPGSQQFRSSFTFTLISTAQNSDIKSSLSTNVTNAVNNTMVRCAGHSTPATVTIRIAG